MRSWVRRLVIPPVFADEDQTRTAYLLFTITRTCAVLAILYFLISLVFLGDPRSTYYVIPLILLIGVVNLMASFGQVRQASIVFAALLWAILTLAILSGNQGIYHVAFSGYLMVVLIAGFLSGTRAGLLFATINGIAGMFMVAWAIATGNLLYSPSDTILRLVIHVIFFFIAAILVALTTGQIKGALERARRHEKALAQRNQELQHEIAEREQVQEAYRLLVEQSLQGLLIYQEGRLVFANPAIVTMLGYTVDELLALENPRTIIHPEDRALFFGETQDRALTRPVLPHYQFRLIRKDGVVRWAELFAVNILYREKPAIQATTIDITERKEAEIRQKENDEELRQLSDASFEGIVISEKGKIVLANEQIAAMLRCERAELYGRNVMDFVAPESREIVLHNLESGYDGTYDHMALRSDGTVFPVEVHGRTMLHAGHTVRVSAIRDITERKRAEQQALELALERERLDLLKEFISNISHDLKTPLTVINTSLYLLERLTEPERQKEKLEQIREQTLLLERFIQDILTMSRLDYTTHFTHGMIDLNRLLENIDRQLQVAAQKKNIQLQLQLENNLVPISGNETEIHRAFVNLIENALKYTLKDGSITIHTEAQDQGIAVVISDTGIGISEEDIPYVFDRFYRVEKARDMDVAGTGLGLSIVKKIIAMHGGEIRVESALGKGSTFRVWLPYTPLETTSEPA
jgi:PAS domain S-box-containing protein